MKVLLQYLTLVLLLMAVFSCSVFAGQYLPSNTTPIEHHTSSSPQYNNSVKQQVGFPSSGKSTRAEKAMLLSAILTTLGIGAKALWSKYMKPLKKGLSAKSLIVATLFALMAAGLYFGAALLPEFIAPFALIGAYIVWIFAGVYYLYALFYFLIEIIQKIMESDE